MMPVITTVECLKAWAMITVAASDHPGPGPGPGRDAFKFKLARGGGGTALALADTEAALALRVVLSANRNQFHELQRVMVAGRASSW
jgi:hypothetical protein